jgi:hypothetical protein
LLRSIPRPFNNYTQGQQQHIWHDEEAAQKLEANQKTLRSAQGKFAATASENGVGGLSIAALTNELNANAGHYASDVEYNRSASDQEIMLQLKGFQDDAQSRLNQIPQPSLLGAAADVAGAGLNAYAAYYPQKNDPNNNLAIPIDEVPYIRAGAVQ